MVSTWISIVLSLLMVSPQEEEHAIYLSTVYLDITATKVNAEVRVFEDDLRAALQDHTGLVTDTTATRFQDDVLSYFRKYLVLQSAENRLEWSLNHIDLVGDSYQIHLSAKSTKLTLSDSWVVRTSYFFELFPTQKNVLRLSDGNQKHYHTFSIKDEVYQIKI